MDSLKRQRLDEVITRYKGEKGSLLAVMREIQRQEGYLSEELIDYISDKLSLPAGQIYGVASYYKVFRTEPGGREEIKVCDGTSCHLKGAGELIARLKRELKVEEGEPTEDQRYTLEKVRCQGYCQIGPALKINEAVHGPVTQEKAIKLIKEQR